MAVEHAAKRFISGTSSLYLRLQMAITMERRAVEMVIRFCPIMTPPLTAMPLMVIYQLFGDAFVAALILCFWFVPILAALHFSGSHSTRGYYLYMGLYFGFLLALIIYLALQNGIGTVIVSALKQADLYIEIIAEVSLANVVVSDLLCANL